MEKQVKHETWYDSVLVSVVSRNATKSEIYPCFPLLSALNCKSHALSTEDNLKQFHQLTRQTERQLGYASSFGAENSDLSLLYHIYCGKSWGERVSRVIYKMWKCIFVTMVVSVMIHGVNSQLWEEKRLKYDL